MADENYFAGGAGRGFVFNTARYGPPPWPQPPQDFPCGPSANTFPQIDQRPHVTTQGMATTMQDEDTTMQNEDDHDIPIDPALLVEALTFNGFTFSITDQRAIIYAMGYANYSAEQFAPFFGVNESGKPHIDTDTVSAVYENLKASTELWDEARFNEVKTIIDVRLHAARKEQNDLSILRMHYE